MTTSTGTTGTTGTTATGAASTGVGLETGRESSLSNWVGPYVTNMLGQGQAIAQTPYQAYTGPLTAGVSNLQNTAFSGLAGLTIPTTKMGAYTPTSFADAKNPAGGTYGSLYQAPASALDVADKTTGKTNAELYMNPFIAGALQPQIDEARRQAQIENLQNRAKLTQSGAFGGSRQAIMESENQRNLLQNLAGITGKGYVDAYDRATQQFNLEQKAKQDALNQAMGQFNIEQKAGQEATNLANQYGLGALQKQAELGAVQRDIEQQGVEADIRQFEAERDFPYKQVQFQQSLLQNLPLATQSYTYSQPSALSSALGNVGGIQQLYDLIFGGGKTPVTPAPAPVTPAPVTPAPVTPVPVTPVPVTPG